LQQCGVDERHRCLRCGNVLVCRNTGLFCGNIRLLCSNIGLFCKSVASTSGKIMYIDIYIFSEGHAASVCEYIHIYMSICIYMKKYIYIHIHIYTFLFRGTRYQRVMEYIPIREYKSVVHIHMYTFFFRGTRC